MCCGAHAATIDGDALALSNFNLSGETLEALAKRGVKSLFPIQAACFDIVLAETFPHPEEGLDAAHAGLQTGLPTWLSLTAGPLADLMSPAVMQHTAERAGDLGVSAILVNCVAATQIRPFLDAISDVGLPFGVYANAGHVDEGLGWGLGDPEHYADLAEEWVGMGATLIGGCCGTGPAHIRALRERFGA